MKKNRFENIDESQMQVWKQKLESRMQEVEIQQTKLKNEMTGKIEEELKLLKEEAKKAAYKVCECRIILEDKIVTERMSPIGNNLQLTPRGVNRLEDLSLTEIALAAEKYEVALTNAQIASHNLNECNFKLQEALDELNNGKKLPQVMPPGHFSVRWGDLNDVIIRDVGCKVSSARAWPLLIDQDGSGSNSRASLFFEYSGSVHVNFFNEKQMEKNRLRTSLLGAIARGL